MTRIILNQVIEEGDEIAVTDNEHHYLTRVRRHREGDEVEVRGLEGRSFSAVVSMVAKDHSVLSIGAFANDVVMAISPVTLAVAVPKGQIMDDVVRKISEIGVARLIPVLCERSTVFPGVEKPARWRRIADASMRQCGRETPLIVEAPMSFEDALHRSSDATCRLILHPEESRMFPSPGPLEKAIASMTVYIGPEGGFTEREVLAAVAADVEPIRLPMPILRIETAAIACAVLSVSLLASLHSPSMR